MKRSRPAIASLFLGEQLSLPFVELVQIGDRVVIFPGLPSQEFGVVVGFIRVHGSDGFFPVMLSDLGYFKVVSYAWGLRKAPSGQTSLF